MNARNPSFLRITAKISPRWASLALLVGIAPITGCNHIPAGGAKELKASFGVPGVFSIKKEMAGVTVTDNAITVDKSSTDIQIALFTWHSSATDLAVPNPKKKAQP